MTLWGEAHAAFDSGRGEDEMFGDVVWCEERKASKETQIDRP